MIRDKREDPRLIELINDAFVKGQDWIKGKDQLCGISTTKKKAESMLERIAKKTRANK